MSLPPLYIALGMLAYFAVILWASRRFSHKIQTLFQFFLAGRHYGALPIALSFVAAWFGAGSSMATVNGFHDHGVSAAWEIMLPSLLSCLFITLFFSRAVADQADKGILSMPEAIETHYGSTGRLLLACILIPYGCTFIGSELIAAIRLLGQTFHMSPLASVLSIAGIISAYSMLGGFFAVVLTDMAQFVLFSGAIVGMALAGSVWALQHPALWQHAASLQPPSYWSLTTDGWKHAFLTLTFVLGWSIAPEMWQRMSATQNRSQAFKAGWLATLGLSLLFLGVFTIGITSLGHVGQSKTVLVDLAFLLGNPFFTVLVLVGLLAAITSTIDSTVNVGSLTLTHDLYQRYLRPSASQPELLWMGRLGTIFMFLPAIGIALSFSDMIEVFWISADLFAATMFFPVAGLLLGWKPPQSSGVLAMIFGATATLVSTTLHYHWLPLPPDFWLVKLWPGYPYSTALGLGFSGLGFALGYRKVQRLSHCERTT